MPVGLQPNLHRESENGDSVNPNCQQGLIREKFLDLHLSKSEATWLMAQIANARQSKTKEIGMDRANVEHIFPQNAGPDWPNRTALEPLIWHVGNLTTLGNRLNNKAQNKSFPNKCKEHCSKSEVAITKDLLNVATWDEAAIRARAKDLSDIALEVWK